MERLEKKMHKHVLCAQSQSHSCSVGVIPRKFLVVQNMYITVTSLKDLMQCVDLHVSSFDLNKGGVDETWHIIMERLLIYSNYY